MPEPDFLPSVTVEGGAADLPGLLRTCIGHVEQLCIAGETRSALEMVKISAEFRAGAAALRALCEACDEALRGLGYESLGPGPGHHSHASAVSRIVRPGEGGFDARD